MSDEQTATTGDQTTSVTDAQGTALKKEEYKFNPPKTPKDWKKVNNLGLALILIPLFIIFSLVELWPTKEPLTKPGDRTLTLVAPTPTPAGTPADSPKEGSVDNSKPSAVWSKQTNIIKFDISFQLRMILLVLLGGALGSYIHMATSFSTYIGFNRFEMNWFWWYLLRIPIGATLALVFSMLIDGRVITVSAGSTESRYVAIIGLAALIGMFSRQATEKLQDVFDTVFNSTEGKKNKERQDTKDNIVKEEKTDPGKNGQAKNPPTPTGKT